jgi:hypothetical protein
VAEGRRISLPEFSKPREEADSFVIYSGRKIVNFSLLGRGCSSGNNCSNFGSRPFIINGIPQTRVVPPGVAKSSAERRHEFLQ